MVALQGSNCHVRIYRLNLTVGDPGPVKLPLLVEKQIR
jgi:hypothetical protein